MSTLTKGCTLISWIAGLLKIVLPEEGCCNEHDLFYEQGGTLRTKIFADWLLAKCVVAINGGWRGWAKAGVGLLVLSLNPYSYFVFFRR